METKVESNADGLVTEIDTRFLGGTWSVKSSEYRLCRKNVEGVFETVLQRMYVNTNLADGTSVQEWVDVPTVEIG